MMTMEEDVYALLNSLDQRGGRHPQQHYSLQPNTGNPPRPLQPRDRYRASRHEPQYDRVEDDEYGDVAPLESFDEHSNGRVLQQSYASRRQPTLIGQTRLSFSPKPPTFRTAGLASQPQSSYRALEAADYDFDERRAHYEERPQLSQYVYSAAQPQESSSDAQLGTPSSPACLASQRRGGHASLRAPQPLGQFDEGGNETYSNDFHDSQQASQQKPRAAVSASAPRKNIPICQGIPLVPITELPDRLRTIFPYPNFNAVQSKCFESVYRSDNNFVLASPTGSGKTAVLELAVCRAISTNATGQYKIVYQAPTKALCSERQRDWQAKFGRAGLNCVELTGDTDAADLRNVQSANIIITTPEKWDSITRKWKDYERLMRLIKLFLIDEVHILKEDRGATLEAIVSRMKSIAADVRFVALSATVPNFGDVAAWLGKNSAEVHVPAVHEKFGEEFRPVRLRKYVGGYQWNNGNDFAFEKSLDTHLPDVISKHSAGKPTMVFCCTRNSTVATAKSLAKWWASRHPRDRIWKEPPKRISFRNPDLRDCAISGVAFHHAGIESDDRVAIEQAFLKGEISVICCTSTLAVGVNLPCHLVVIKNTVTFARDNILQEYSDLEVMQMLGRAGRPQFDDSAIAVIMTRQSKVAKYEKMVTGQDVLESTLHLNLIDHLNAEIGLGTIRDPLSARKWLMGTFLYVRLKQNPAYYKLDGARSGQSIDEQLDAICFRDIALLRDYSLASGDQYLRSTEFGHAMARYCIHFDSMRTLMGLKPKASISEILSAVAQASEFGDIRFRAGEKALYKIINKSSSIRFPIPVNLDLTAHKVSLLIQSVLGAADIAWDGDLAKHKAQYTREANVVFKDIIRLVRCIIDCQICLGDSESINHALILERSLTARVWDDSPLQMKQIDGIGVVGVRKLVNMGIRSIEELDCTDSHRIEMVLGRNPPFGMQVLEKLKAFPKLRVSLQMQPKSLMKTSEGAKMLVKADIGFLNEKPIESFNSRPVYICLLAETSDNRKAYFSRTSARNLSRSPELNFPVLLRSPNLTINCYIMCEGIAGTSRSASVTPKIPLSMFPNPKSPNLAPPHVAQPPMSNISKRRTESGISTGKTSISTDEFGDNDIDDDVLVKAMFRDLDFDHIDNYANPADNVTRKNTTQNASSSFSHEKSHTKPNSREQSHVAVPRQLENGNWACNHPCKDKQACKHLCCKDGMAKPPRKPCAKRVSSMDAGSQSTPKGPTDREKKTQTKLQLAASKRKAGSTIEELDLTQQDKRRKIEYTVDGRSDFQDLQSLHRGVQNNPPSTISSIVHQKPAYCYSKGRSPRLSFLDAEPESGRPNSESSDYGDSNLEDLVTDLHQLDSGGTHTTKNDHQNDSYSSFNHPDQDKFSETYGDDESFLEDAMVGVADSEELRATGHGSHVATKASENLVDTDYDYGLDENVLNNVDEATTVKNDVWSLPQWKSASSNIPVPAVPLKEHLSVSKNDYGSRPHDDYAGFESTPGSFTLKQAKHAVIAPALPPRASEGNKFHGQPTTGIYAESTSQELDNVDLEKTPEEEHIPEAYKDLEPWVFKEFGDIVELVD